MVFFMILEMLGKSPISLKRPELGTSCTDQEKRNFGLPTLIKSLADFCASASYNIYSALYLVQLQYRKKKRAQKKHVISLK